MTVNLLCKIQDILHNPTLVTCHQTHLHAPGAVSLTVAEPRSVKPFASRSQGRAEKIMVMIPPLR